MRTISWISIPSRSVELVPTLECLLAQGADRVRLHIPRAYRRFPNWDGTLPSAPTRRGHDALQRNRSATISHKCVSREGGVKLPFREARDTGFSTLDAPTAKDRHATRRVPAGIYDVETITLHQLLSEHDAPQEIDYLSIDTEGSEFDILETFDFERYRPLVMTIEHNYRPDRENIVALMSAQGYVRAPTRISAYEDWFVSPMLAHRLSAIFTQDALENG